MYKLESISKLLQNSLPKQVKENPENLIIQATEGSIEAAFGDSLGFVYHYNLEITVCNWPASLHTDAIFVPLLAWLAVHQSDLLDNPDKRKNAMRFHVNALVPDCYDIGIDIPLRESVLVEPDPNHPTRYNAKHLREPCHVSAPCIDEHWELWLKDQKLAEWDVPRADRISRFGL